MSNRVSTPQQETFTRDQIISAIRSFLTYGEQQFGKSQQGYFSDGGFAARALQYHLTQLAGATSRRSITRRLSEMERAVGIEGAQDLRPQNTPEAASPDPAVDRALAFVAPFQADPRCSLNGGHAEALAAEVFRLRVYQRQLDVCDAELGFPDGSGHGRVEMIQALQQKAASDHTQCHDFACNTDKARYPRGTKGVSCGCKGRDAAYAKLVSVRAQIEQMPFHRHPTGEGWILKEDVLAILDAPVAQCGVHPFTPDSEGICTGCGGRAHWGHRDATETTPPKHEHAWRASQWSIGDDSDWETCQCGEKRRV